MSTTLEYRCPNCNGTLSFRSESQNLTCPFCDTEFETQAILEYNQAIDAVGKDDCTWETYESNTGSGAWSQEEASNLVTYICQACNGEVVAEKTTAVTSCPYCDNNIFIPKQFSDELRPDYVIPFKLNKDQAKEALRQFYKGKPLLNPCFKDENQLDEIKGIYVPFWLFDCDTNNDLHYKATRVRTYSDARFNHTETKHYSIQRSGTLDFRKIPADGSSKMDDTFMEAIEPFDYTQLEEFNPAFFAGYMADKYDVPAESLQKRINERIRSSVLTRFQPRGYASVRPESSNIRFDKNEVRYALLPVWVLNTRYHGEVHTFIMNGQTGKMVGKLPLDVNRTIGMFLGIFGGLSALTTAIIMLLL